MQIAVVSAVSEVSWRGHCSSVTSSAAQPDWVLHEELSNPAAAAAVQKRRTYKSTSVTQSVWFSFIREVLFAFIISPYRLSLIRVSYIAKTTQLVKVTLAELKVNHQNGRWMKRNRAEQWKRERIALRSLYSFLFMPKFIFNIIMLYDFQNMHSTEHKETLNVLHLQRQS